MCREGTSVLELSATPGLLPTLQETRSETHFDFWWTNYLLYVQSSEQVTCLYYLELQVVKYFECFRKKISMFLIDFTTAM